MGDTLKHKIIASYVLTIVVALVIINVVVNTMFAQWSLARSQELIMAYAKNLQYIATQHGLDMDDSFKEAVSNCSHRSGARVIVADENGNVILSSGSEASWKQIKSSSIVKAAYEGKDASGEYIDDGGIRFIYVAVPVVIDSNVTGVIMLACMVDAAYSAVEDAAKNLAVVSIVIMLLLGLITYVMVDRITSPLHRITKAIESMDKGTLKQQVIVTGRDEIAKLGKAFNQMNSKVTMIDEQRRALVANASHELKSPMAGMKVLVQALINGGLEDRKVAYDFLNDIDREIDRLTETVGDLLELTKLEGEYGVKSEKFDLGLLCTEVANKLSFKAEEKKLCLEMDAIPIRIEANRDQILRVVYNILENAMKYSPEESHIHLWLEKGAMATVCISDQGSGIAQEEIPKIFERFYRLERARNRKTGGSGLGLPIALEIVRRHGGDIKVESQVGQGSTFSIYLPYRQIG